MVGTEYVCERLVFTIGDNNKIGRETTVNSMTQWNLGMNFHHPEMSSLVLS